MTIPDWAHFNGMNDRFAVLGPKSAAKWKDRLAYTLHHCLDKPLHAEMFAQDFAVDHDFDVRPPDTQARAQHVDPLHFPRHEALNGESCTTFSRSQG